MKNKKWKNRNSYRRIPKKKRKFLYLRYRIHQRELKPIQFLPELIKAFRGIQSGAIDFAQALVPAMNSIHRNIEDLYLLIHPPRQIEEVSDQN